MYTPAHFNVTDENRLFDFIESYSFGIIISLKAGIPVATHMPFLLDRAKKQLNGHFAKANNQWEKIEGQEVLLIFQGPHHYISPSWYETNLSVPTWNYIVVHVYGKVELMTESEDLLKTLNELTIRYEEPERGYRIDSSNRDFINGLMKGIVGFRINITKIEGKWKLSQNHSVERQERVIHELEQIKSDNALQISKYMKKNVLE